MTPDAPYYLVIDLEATCERGGALPPKETEIIEIGAVLVRAGTFAAEGEFQTFVRPVAHPRLTAFCTELTSITQADVDRAPTFPAALVALRNFLAGRDALFCSWGEYDRNQFKRDAHRHRVSLPFGGRHLNLKALFSEALGESERFGMAGALRRVGLPLEGTHHRGIDDARNIAKLLPYALGVAQPKPRGRSWEREGRPAG
jgi:3'-5' exoribonuclease 1